MNKYPVYVISKGRYNLKNHTAVFLLKDGIDVKIVIEPQEEADYSKRFGREHLLILPFSNLGLGGIPARNWVWEHAKESGAKRHWILDDNISGMKTWKNGKRVKCNAQVAFNHVEKFIDKFENIAIGGIQYTMFCMTGMTKKLKPFYHNCHVYSCLLILNELPFRWRGRYNEDTDLCLQALTQNWCTVNVNAFMVDKMATMTCKGGNTDELYKDNGRLKMSRSLELQWKDKFPNLVKTIWRFNRPQHHVNWSIFKTQLKLKDEHNG